MKKYKNYYYSIRTECTIELRLLIETKTYCYSIYSFNKKMTIRSIVEYKDKESAEKAAKAHIDIL